MKFIKSGIAIIILISMLVLSSCEYLPFLSGDKSEGQNQNTENQGGTQQNTENNNEKETEKEYWGTKTLYSYEDLMDALAIVRQYHKPKHKYTVNDMGEDYTVFYQFYEPHALISYPIDYNTFFTTVSDGSFETIIFLENQTCSGHEMWANCGCSYMHTSRNDEDFEKHLAYYRKQASISVESCIVPVEITDISKLKYDENDRKDHFLYDVIYDGDIIIELRSCVKLDEAFFEVFFNSIVIA